MFDVVEIGLDNVEVIIPAPVERPLLNRTLPIGLPPVIPTIKEYVEEDLDPTLLPIFAEQLPLKPPPDLNFDEMIEFEPTLPPTSLILERNIVTGESQGFKEVQFNYTPLEISRPPTVSNSFKAGSKPFLPSGFPISSDRAFANSEDLDLDEDHYLTCPPGFDAGVNFTFASEIKKVDISENVEIISQEKMPNILVPPKVKREHITHAIKLHGLKYEDEYEVRVPCPARTWPFQLDVFQKLGIMCIERHQNVFIAAHTSSGKTVVAEYAIALSQKRSTRVIYTSPIKALSNQKFRDFKNIFDDVGILTGDVQINQSAFCLIMTTEILRSMLYNGAEIVRDLEFVIFDEIHYINDEHRGVVWEEVLIMLPEHVKIIMLSATVPNEMEFASWVGKIKQTKIYVISTLKRPVPLEHYLYTGSLKSNTGNLKEPELYKIVEKSSPQIIQRAYRNALASVKDKPRTAKQSDQMERQSLRTFVKYLESNNHLPVIFFTFSKNKIEENVEYLRSVNLNSKNEQHQVNIFLKWALANLNESDRKLPQVLRFSECLRRGIGAHHSGILPILKESVEMLFQKMLVKVLFATETFAMGINMPARTVVFDSIEKHDGNKRRFLLPGEYIQMAGRAGRRGLDDTGTVIIRCTKSFPEIPNLHSVLVVKPTPLESKFRLTYSMILQFFRVPELNIDDMLLRSYSQFFMGYDERNKQLIQEKQSLLEELPDLSSCNFCFGEEIENLLALSMHCHTLTAELFSTAVFGKHFSKLMQPGRVVLLNIKPYFHHLAVFIGFTQNRELPYLFLVLDKEIDSGKVSEFIEFLPLALYSNKLVIVHRGQLALISCSLQSIVRLHKSIISVGLSNEACLSSPSEAVKKLESVGEELFNSSQNLTFFSIDEMINDKKLFLDVDERIKTLAARALELESCQALDCPSLSEHYSICCQRYSIQCDIEKLSFNTSAKSSLLYTQYEQRVKVLEALKYIDESNQLTLKGRVACEISHKELIATELLFKSDFVDLNVEVMLALLSCLLVEGRSYDTHVKNALIVENINRLECTVKSIAQTQIEAELHDDIEDQLKFNFCDSIYQWACQESLSSIIKSNSIQEGLFVRCVQRLDELVRELYCAAITLGNPKLASKMEKASQLIRRDIIFAKSLYLP